MKYFFFLLLIFLSALVTNAQQRHLRIELSAEGGVQSSDFTWSIAGNSAGASPNVLSEVKWRRITGPAILAAIKFELSLLMVGAEYGRSEVRSGKAEDIDYADDDRRSPIYSANLDADEGNSDRYTLYAGCHLTRRNKLRIAVITGYSSENQHFFLLQHNNDVAGNRNLRSTYDVRWSGALCGIKVDYDLTSTLSLKTTLVYSQLKYQAEADWNLIDAFKHPLSFKQTANGFKVEPSVNLAYQFSRHIAIYVKGCYAFSETGQGIDNLFLDSGDIQLTRFNGAVTNRKSVTLGTYFCF